MSLTGAPNEGELTLETTDQAEKRVEGNAGSTPLSSAELDKKYSVTPPQNEEVFEVTVEKSPENDPTTFLSNEHRTKAEAQAAFVMGDMEGFKGAYISMVENKIAQEEATIAKYQNSNFEDAYKGTSFEAQSQAWKKDHAAYMVQSAQNTIADLREHSIKQVQEKPEDIAQRDDFLRNLKQDSNGQELKNLVRDALKEAEGLLRREREAKVEKGAMYPVAEATITALVEAAFKYKNPETLAFIKERFKGESGLPAATNVMLPPSLQAEVDKL